MDTGGYFDIGGVVIVIKYHFRIIRALQARYAMKYLLSILGMGFTHPYVIQTLRAYEIKKFSDKKNSS